MNNKKSDRPEHRTALVGLVLQRFNIDITALSEMHLADTEEIRRWSWLHHLLVMKDFG